MSSASAVSSPPLIVMGLAICASVLVLACEPPAPAPEVDASTIGAPCDRGSSSCAPGQLCCAGECIDPGSDLRHCGGCGSACSGVNEEVACVAGVCQSLGCLADEEGRPLFYDCPGDGRGCGTEKSARDCGGCGDRCGAGESCDPSGACTCGGGPVCASVHTCCDGACADTDNDARRCGSCDYNCYERLPGVEEAGCNEGVCIIRRCRAGLLDCPGDGDGCGTLEGELNCGGCGIVCGAGQSCCDGACVDLEHDAANCGVCGARCGPRLSCCGGLCLDTRSSGEHCGGCGVTCAAGELCRGGLCR